MDHTFNSGKHPFYTFGSQRTEKATLLSSFEPEIRLIHVVGAIWLNEGSVVIPDT